MPSKVDVSNDDIYKNNLNVIYVIKNTKIYTNNCV